MKKKRILSCSLAISLPMALALCGCFPKGPEERLIGQKCTKCHTTSRIYKKARPDKEWEEIVDRMIRHGASLSAKEKKTILKFLKAKY